MPIQVFGQGAVQTAYVSFLPIDLTTASTILIWPTSYVDVPYTKDGINYNALAASMTVQTAIANTFTVTLPDATMSSVGSNFIITNIGQSAFDLLKFDSSQLINIPNTALSNSFWVQLIDNSTPAGEWQFVAFGAGASQAQSSTLAGNGLVALSSLLNTNMEVQAKSTSYSVVSSDRATMIVWKGGTETITLPAIGDVPAGFYVSFNNGGSGSLIVQAVDSANIDNLSSITLAPYQSMSVVSDGSVWWTLGFGQNVLSSLFQSGSAASPSISFLDDNTTGFFYTFPYILSASVNGFPMISITPTGIDLAIPLGIQYGGTGQTTASTAISALMPTSVTGAMVYFDGSSWVTLPPGGAGAVLMMTGGIPTWSM
jgi:hypothetical protein